jgi:hypothetical protein
MTSSGRRRLIEDRGKDLSGLSTKHSPLVETFARRVAGSALPGCCAKTTADRRDYCIFDTIYS